MISWSIGRRRSDARRSRAWILSLALFLAGSVLSGAAWNTGSLIAFRVLQGTGAGLMQPIVQTLLVQAAGQRRLGRAISIITVLAVVAPIFGPVVGGLIVSNLSWRWIFYVNVPLCVAALLLAWRGLPATPPQGELRLDIRGLVLLSPGLAAIIYGLSQVGTHGGFDSAAVIVPLGIGVVLLAAFVIHALRTRDQPIVNLRLFHVRSFAAAGSLMFLSGLSLFGAMLLLPLDYQQVRGQSALAAGLLLAPQGVGSLLTRWAGALTDRIGPRPIVLGGMALATLGTLPYTQVGPHTSEALQGRNQCTTGGWLSLQRTIWSLPRARPASCRSNHICILLRDAQIRGML
jgi:EmrB/QacA subfamily drug resistance transporter